MESGRSGCVDGNHPNTHVWHATIPCMASKSRDRSRRSHASHCCRMTRAALVLMVFGVAFVLSSLIGSCCGVIRRRHLRCHDRPHRGIRGE